MLVLSRKQMESLLIGQGVRVTVLKVDRNQVRLGIEAPRDVSILRSELADGPETTPAAHPAPMNASRV